jgi:hypothetical protein
MRFTKLGLTTLLLAGLLAGVGLAMPSYAATPDQPFAPIQQLSFTLNSNVSDGTVAVQQGQVAAPVDITVTSTTGFVVVVGGNSSTIQPLSYTCSGLPPEAECTFSPASTSNQTALSLSISTSPTIRALRHAGSVNRMFYAVLLPGLLGLVLTLGSRRPAARGVRVLSWFLVLGVATLSLSSCAGSSSTKSPGTPKGTYPITVNASTGGNNPLSSSINFKLTVN